MGAWVTYGLGSESRNLPGFVVLQSGPRGPRGGASLWASGFLPTSYQGVPFRSKGDPILHLHSPAGHRRRRASATFTTRVGGSESRAAGRDGRPRNPHADQRLRNGVPHADQRAGADGPVEGIAGDARAVRREAGQAVVRRRTACSPAGWSSAASGSCSSITRTGTATAAPART